MSIRRRYYLPDPAAGPLRRLRRRLTGRPVPPFPRNVQIQTATGCNADCVFCPYGMTHTSQPHGRMDWELFRDLVDECARHPVRRISPYLMNEPFLDPELPERIACIRERAPACRVVVTSNGSLLRPEVIDRLLDRAARPDVLCLSIQGIDPGLYRRTMRGAVRLPETLRNVDALLARLRARRLRRPEVRVTMVRSGLLDRDAARRYWRARGVRSRITALDNRGGNLFEDELAPAGAFEPNTTCTRLFKQAYILFNGDMVLCCADWRRKVVLGNVRRRSIEAVWNGDTAVGIRRAYLEGRFADLVLCRDCRVDRVGEGDDPGVAVLLSRDRRRGAAPIAVTPGRSAAGSGAC